LNIIAEYPNGTQIGTTFNNTGYIQHTPGMWLTVTPPDATIPYTGDIHGRESPSVRPFQGVQLYSYHDPPHTVTSSSPTGRTPAARTGLGRSTLDQNTTLIAIYEQT
jgi:hypothetical protein